jgi:hypothetical protein
MRAILRLSFMVLLRVAGAWQYSAVRLVFRTAVSRGSARLQYVASPGLGHGTRGGEGDMATLARWTGRGRSVAALVLLVPLRVRRTEGARSGRAERRRGHSDPARAQRPARLVAFGDVHGDLGATRAALRLAGAIDQRDRWIGGPLVVVQTGDQLDRGPSEREILHLFERLRRDAARAGGAFHALNGNHELMNALPRLPLRHRGGFPRLRRRGTGERR